ncbi:nuclear transport factor 2 family protein [Myxococcota bacterium]|nr:nuclear transport factor 2 family protein [Myxococcota bacterium]
MDEQDRTFESHLAVARRLTECLMAGDVAGVEALYHEDVVTWRNLDGRELVKRQMLKIVSFLADAVADLKYSELRVQPTPTGYVQQHVLHGVARSGETVAAATCMVVEVREGRIVRVDEYMDSAAMAPLMG